MCGRLCDAAERYHRHCRVGRPRFPDEDAGHAEADRAVSVPGLLVSGELMSRPEMVVGWYHSHPGFGCWLSSVDVNTQQVRRRRTSR